jgi:protein-disulfide isomerase
MSKTLLSHLATTLMVCCAVAVTAAVVRREFFPAPAAANEPDLTPRPVENWAELASAGQRMGPADAPVTIVEFSDFQCPFCATFAETLRAARAKHPDRVAVLYRHYPIDQLHPEARAAALASECAAAQNRFEPYHDQLFAQQDSIGRKPWERFALEAGVPDLDAFTRCVGDGTRMAGVERDFALAEATGVTLTPTVIINGTLVPGALSPAELDKWIAEPPR